MQKEPPFVDPIGIDRILQKEILRFWLLNLLVGDPSINVSAMMTLVRSVSDPFVAQANATTRVSVTATDIVSCRILTSLIIRVFPANSLQAVLLIPAFVADEATVAVPLSLTCAASRYITHRDHAVATK